MVHSATILSQLSDSLGGESFRALLEKTCLLTSWFPRQPIYSSLKKTALGLT